MTTNVTDLIKRIETSSSPAVTTNELCMLKNYTNKVFEYELLCGKLYKFDNKQLRIV